MRNDVVMVVHHDCQRLTKYNGRPDYDVAAPGSVLLFHKLRKERERYLRHHTHEGPYLERLQRDAHQVLVEEGTDEEHEHRSGNPRIAHLHDRDVQVTDTPSATKISYSAMSMVNENFLFILVNRHIPSPPERIDIVGIPPIAVKVAIGKVKQLSHQVQERVEGQIEEAQPHQVVWNL